MRLGGEDTGWRVAALEQQLAAAEARGEIDGDDEVMCGCEARPAGGTYEKAWRGGGCGSGIGSGIGGSVNGVASPACSNPLRCGARPRRHRTARA